MNTALSTNTTLPEVTFDIQLGEKFSYVDFDYQEYAKLIDEQGVPADALEAHESSIHFQPSKFWSRRSGGYNREKHHIDVLLSVDDVKTSIKVPNSSLLHETKHMVDHIEDSLPWLQSGIPAGIGSLAVLAALPLGVFQPIQEQSEKAFHYEAASYLEQMASLSRPAAIVLGIIGVASLVYYWNMSHEKRARQFASQYENREILRLTPKDPT